MQKNRLLDFNKEPQERTIKPTIFFNSPWTPLEDSSDLGLHSFPLCSPSSENIEPDTNPYPNTNPTTAMKAWAKWTSLYPFFVFSHDFFLWLMLLDIICPQQSDVKVSTVPLLRQTIIFNSFIRYIYMDITILKEHTLNLRIQHLIYGFPFISAYQMDSGEEKVLCFRIEVGQLCGEEKWWNVSLTKKRKLAF